MVKENIPFLSDEFLDDLAKEINQQFGGPSKEIDEDSDGV
jgi:hypothetical protein